jgi:hypothetical protein
MATLAPTHPVPIMATRRFIELAFRFGTTRGSWIAVWIIDEDSVREGGLIQPLIRG